MTQAREALGTRTEVGGGTGALARVGSSQQLLAGGLAQDQTVAVPRVWQIWPWGQRTRRGRLLRQRSYLEGGCWSVLIYTLGVGLGPQRGQAARASEAVGSALHDQAASLERGRCTFIKINQIIS